MTSVTGAQPSIIARLQQSISGMSDASGNLTLTWPQVPIGTRNVGTMAVPGAPNAAQFSAAIGPPGGPTQPLLTWTGPTPVGPVTLEGNEVLTVTGTSLTASTTYLGQLQGQTGPADLVTPAIPQGPPLSVQVLNEIIAGPQPNTYGGYELTFSNVTPTHTLLGSLGPGHAYRVFYIGMMVTNNSSTAGQFGFLRIKDSISNNRLADTVVPPQNSLAFPMPFIPVPAGLVMSDNAAIVAEYNPFNIETCTAAITLYTAQDH